MLNRQLRYSVDPFATFFRLGAECWGPRVADPFLEVKLASEDPARKEERIGLEEDFIEEKVERRRNEPLIK